MNKEIEKLIRDLNSAAVDLIYLLPTYNSRLNGPLGRLTFAAAHLMKFVIDEECTIKVEDNHGN